MVVADSGKRQLASLSSYRQRPVLEWSKQISRSTVPFFLTSPTPNLRQSYGAEPPGRNKARIVFEKVPGRDAGSPEPPEDTREYNPKLFDELHPHCSVDIKRSLPRTNIFVKAAVSEACIDPFEYPGWGKGRGSNLPKAAKESFIDRSVTISSMSQNSPDATSVNDYSNKSRNKSPGRAASAMDVSTQQLELQSTHPRTIGALFGKAPRMAKLAEDKRDPLAADLVDKPHTVNIGRCSSRLKDPKPSESYRKILCDPAIPSTAPPKAKITQGFAPVRHNHRLTLHDLLGQTAADVTRARSVMETYFGERSRSELRNTLLYTPSLDGTSGV